MGKIDAEAKRFFSNPVVVADLFNAAVFEGDVIDPSRLRPVNTVEAASRRETGEAGGGTVEKTRDVLVLAEHEANGQTLCILGIENQAQVDFAMPVRCLTYDAMQYSRQVSSIIKAREERFKAANPGKKFYGGMTADDRIAPVKTVVVFLNPGLWTGPRSLHQMFADCPEDILRAIPDYKLELIVPAEMREEDLNRCTSELREVLAFIRASNDKGVLGKLVEGNDRFKALSTDAARLINVVTDARLPIDPEEEVFNMCEAIKAIQKDARELGEENYKRRLRNLRAKMKETSRQEEFFEAIEDDARLESLFREFHVD